jgi:hypothetical protein
MMIRMKTRYMQWILLGSALAFFPWEANAGGKTIQELKSQLQERDKVILELLERVEALEQRVGVKRTAEKPGDASAHAPEAPEKKGKRH